MQSIPTQFKVLDLVRERLRVPGADPQGNSGIIERNPELAYIGALGPALADYLPPTPGEEGGLGVGNQYLKLWTLTYSLVGDDMRVPRGLFSVLKKMNAFLEKVGPIADAEDFGALQAIEDEVSVINETAEDLKTIVEQIPDLIPLIGSGVGAGMKPRVNVAPGTLVPPDFAWEPRNFLAWSKTGEFTAALVDAAKDSGDERCQAFAFGWVVSWVTDTVGAPFINSIVNGPYRLHWWRHRWIGNYIAAWVHGFYEAGASISGDTPTPTYADWKNLCNAGLQEKIELPGLDPQAVMQAVWKNDPLPEVLPPAVGKCVMVAFERTYGAPPPGSHFTAENLNGAYILTWLQLWFQTSGEGLGCNPLPPLGPPPDCGGIPSWVDPMTPGDSGAGSLPPSPSVESNPDVGEIVSGVLLALLGLAALAFGGGAAGAAAIAAGIRMIYDGATEVDWAKLRCDIYWYRLYLFNGLQALHEILTLGGFAYPYAKELGDDSTTVELLDIPFTFDSGKAVTKSKGRRDLYPAAVWSGLISTWNSAPTGLEAPSTVGYLSQAYPNHFVDKATLLNGKVRIGGAWPVQTGGAAGASLPVEFGNAVDNSLDALSHLGGELPDWNLDGDRSLASLTWRFKNGVYTDPVDIEPEP